MSTSQNPDDPNVYFFSRDRIAFVARLMALCIVVTILLIPIFLFSLLDLSREITLIIVMVFVLLFAAVVSLFAGASMEMMLIGTCT